MRPFVSKPKHMLERCQVADNIQFLLMDFILRCCSLLWIVRHQSHIHSSLFYTGFSLDICDEMDEFNVQLVNLCLYVLDGIHMDDIITY
jgi:hypothetical protein